MNVHSFTSLNGAGFLDAVHTRTHACTHTVRVKRRCLNAGFYLRFLNLAVALTHTPLHTLSLFFSLSRSLVTHTRAHTKLCIFKPEEEEKSSIRKQDKQPSPDCGMRRTTSLSVLERFGAHWASAVRCWTLIAGSRG